ncbi:sugar transferase [Blastococcus sp. SYSU DS0552]
MVVRRAGRVGGARTSATKRVLDVCVSAGALALLSPVLAVAAVAVRASLGSPVIYRQDRPGLDGRSFRMYKLRTLSDARDSAGEPLPDAQRQTKLGAFLRGTSVDELPELWNVLRGDMSLVGPRPLLHRYTAWFTPEERRRFDVRPGITGWAQINGRNDMPWDERLAHDVWYVDNWSLMLDLRILARTALGVLRREGVVIDPGSAMLNLDDERRMRTGS